LGVSIAVLQFKRPLSPTERDRLFGALTRLDYLNSLMVLVARQSVGNYKELYPSQAEEEVAVARKGRAWLSHVTRMQAVYGSCVDPKAIAAQDPRLAP
jgi:hypothetical protein